jgi:hypothetical protein
MGPPVSDGFGWGGGYGLRLTCVRVVWCLLRPSGGVGLPPAWVVAGGLSLSPGYRLHCAFWVQSEATFLLPCQ